MYWALRILMTTIGPTVFQLNSARNCNFFNLNFNYLNIKSFNYFSRLRHFIYVKSEFKYQ